MDKIPDNETLQGWIHLHRAQKILLEKVENRLRKAHLPPLAWYDVLLELNREKDSGLRQFEIGDKILLAKHNLSRLIDRLEKNRLVGRYECEEDNRGNIVKITNQGEKMLKKMWFVYGHSIQEIFGSKLNNRESKDLIKLLNKLLV